MTPSSVARSIAELEKAVNLRLFERTSRGIRLNAYGEAVLIRASRISEEINEAADLFSRKDPKSGSSLTGAIVNVLYDNRKLQLLIHIDGLKNVFLAAARMGITPAGASMALARIEAVFGQSLFDRRAEGLIATEATNQLLIHARRIQAELRHMASDLSAISGSLAGAVVVGTTPLGRTQVFPRAIAAAVSDHPGLRVIPLEGAYEQLAARLRSGDIDIMFGALHREEHSHGVLSEPLFKDRLALLVRAEHPLLGRREIRLSELASEGWILPRSNALAKVATDALFAAHGLDPPAPSVETGDPSLIRELLRDSDMLAVTSAHQLSFEVQAGFLAELPVTFGAEMRDVGITIRDGAILSPAALAVVEAVRRTAGDPQAGLP
jgi:LysR family transcriptional regulator of gallate degradation